MAEKSYRDAIRDAMIEEMDRDSNVLIMGEDIGVYEGTFRITAGMLKKYGPKRVIDTPIAEAGMAGTAVGMAMLGLRPIVEMMTMNFAIVAADQILNHAAKVRYFSGGQVDVPVVIRGPQGAGVQLSAQHSQTFESFYGHFPGLKVVAPATPADAKGLLKTAIRVHHFFHGSGHVLLVRNGEQLEVACVRHRHILACDTFDRRVELVEDGLGDAGGDLRRRAERLPLLLNDHAAMGLRHRLVRGLKIERTKRAKVDDFRLDAFVVRQLFRDLQ